MSDRTLQALRNFNLSQTELRKIGADIQPKIWAKKIPVTGFQKLALR